MKNAKLIIFASVLLHGISLCSEDEKVKITIDKIIESMPFHSERAIAQRDKFLKDYLNLARVDDIRKQFVSGAAIEPMHAASDFRSMNQSSKEYKENDAYYYLVAYVIYWECNVNGSVSGADQVAYFSKQHPALLERWVEVAMNVMLDSSKKLAPELLKRGVFGSKVCGSFHDYSEWWGDPSHIIDPKDIKLWPEASRVNVLQLLRYSADDKFKLEVAKALVNDDSPVVQRTIASLIKKGMLPRQDKEENSQK